MEYPVERTLSALYIYLDIPWLVILAAVLLFHRRYLAVIAGLAGGIIYFLVDYGLFFHLLGTRQVAGADPFWFLLWLSLSYGFTNFAWIWLLLDRDGKAVEWSLLVIVGWMAVGLVSQSYGGGFGEIAIRRGVGSYHGGMALVLAVGYIGLALRNLRAGPGERVDLLRLLAIGIGVQFSWEAVLLLTGIRPAGLLPLALNSLLETNLGLPYLYLIHRRVTAR